MSNMGAEQRGKMPERQQNRDIPEKIALGLAKRTMSKESMLDSRLFNRESLGNSFGDEDGYGLYDRPLFHGSTAALLSIRQGGTLHLWAATTKHLAEAPKKALGRHLITMIASGLASPELASKV